MYNLCIDIGIYYMQNTLIYILLLSSILFSQVEYSKEDMNSTSDTYGELVWSPTYDGYITLHYFTTQGWAGWTSIFGQLSDFQEELHSEGYEKVVIIGIGQSNMSNFNSNFCANSNIPLVLDQNPSLPIHAAYNGAHRDVIVMASDGVTELYRAAMNSTYFPLYEDDFREIIISNYPTDSIAGDLNADGIVNILDIVQLANMILSFEYSNEADLNSDDTVNILDIVQIVNIILSNE